MENARYAKIHFYPYQIVPQEIEHHTIALLTGNDEKDIPYLRFSLFFQHKIWTGDRPIRNGLLAKGFDNCISPEERLLKHL